MMKKHLSVPALMAVFMLVFNPRKAAAQNTAPHWSLAGNSNTSAASKLGTTNNTALRLYTNNLERFRIDSVGNIGVGLTKPIGKFSIRGSGGTPAASWVLSGKPIFTGFGESGVGNGDFILAMASNTANARGVLLLRRARGTLAAPAAVANNDFLGSLLSSGYDGSTFQNPATIDFYADGAPSSGNVPARISFVTGTNNLTRTERLRIGSTGNIAFNGNQLYLDNSSGNVSIGSSPRADFKLNVGSGSYGSIFCRGDVVGILAYTNSDYGTAISGQGSDISGTGIFGNGGSNGVRGVSYGEGGSGVSGSSYEANGYGVEGDADGSQGIGVYGRSDNYYGVYGSTGTGAYAGYFDGSVYSNGSYVGSDRKLKQNIIDLHNAMSIINKLQPKTYEYRQDSNYKLMNLPQGTRYGLIAQDMEKVLPNLVKATSFETRIANPVKQEPGKRPVQKEAASSEKIDFKAVNYTELIPIMIKGMQEQDAENKELKEQVAALQDRLTKLETLFTNQGTGGVSLNSAYLEQNSPNPVAGTTTIRYQVPLTAASARLTITNAKGQLIKTITIGNKGAGQLNFNTAMLAAGTYQYSLWVDGKQADTKRLVVTR